MENLKPMLVTSNKNAQGRVIKQAIAFRDNLNKFNSKNYDLFLEGGRAFDQNSALDVARNLILVQVACESCMEIIGVDGNCREALRQELVENVRNGQITDMQIIECKNLFEGGE